MIPSVGISGDFRGVVMRVLLVATNQTDRFQDRMVVRPMPIGLAYLAASVDESRHEMRVLDLMFAKDGADEVEAAVKDFQPDVVGLSIRNLDNQSYFNPVSNLPAIKTIVQRIRAQGKAITVCGGPAFSILPARCLEYVEADLGVVGDATQAFAQLLERLDDDVDYKDIPGLVYKENGQTIVREGNFSSTFEVRPRLDLLDMKKYDGSGFGVGVITKLAAVYYPKVGDTTWHTGEDRRIREVAVVLDEIKGIQARYGIRKFYFISSGFNVPCEDAKLLCKAIIDANLGIRWNTGISPNDFDGELAELMKRAGCSLTLLNEGSATAEDLTSRLNQLRETSAICKSVELPHTMNVAFGLPGETEETVNEKLDFLRETQPVFVVLRVGNRLLPYSTLSRIAIEEGVIANEEELLEPRFYVNSAVRDWLPERLQNEASEHPRWNVT